MGMYKIDKGKLLKEKKYSKILQTSEVLVLPRFPWNPVTTAYTFDSLQRNWPMITGAALHMLEKTASWWLPPPGPTTSEYQVWEYEHLAPFSYVGTNSVAESCCGFRLKLTLQLRVHPCFTSAPSCPVLLALFTCWSFLGVSINKSHASEFLSSGLLLMILPKTQTLKDTTITTSLKWQYL